MVICDVNLSIIWNIVGKSVIDEYIPGSESLSILIKLPCDCGIEVGSQPAGNKMDLKERAASTLSVASVLFPSLVAELPLRCHALRSPQLGNQIILRQPRVFMFH